MLTQPLIIFLNGPSSAGKTTLSHAIQESATIPFLHIGIDKVIGMMPHKYNDWINSYDKTNTPHKEGFWFEKKIITDQQIEQELKSGPYGKKISDLLMDITLLMLSKSYNLIIDEVCIDLQVFDLWKNILTPYQTLFVGITCEQKTLEAREKKRGNRMIGSALNQSKTIHINKKYDLFLETSHHSPEELALLILEKIFSINHI